MSVATTTRKQQFTLDGATSAFTFTFRALTSAPTDIKCISTTNGTDTILTYTTNYSVAVNASGIGGTVTLVAPVTTGFGTLTVYRETTNTQGSDYDDYNQFPADTVETDFDIRTLISQEQGEVLDRSLSLPISITGVSVELPSPSSDKVIAWNTAATALVNKDVIGQGSMTLPVPVSQGGTEGITAAAARTNLSVAKSGANSDITVLNSVVTATIGTLKVTTISGANAAGGVVVLDGSAKLPAVDGSALTGIVHPAQVGLGAWVDKTSDYAAQQAATDGFVLVWSNAASAGGVSISTDANSNPTTVRGGDDYAAGYAGTTFCPVKKGDYWKVTAGAAPQKVWWIPLGS